MKSSSDTKKPIFSVTKDAFVWQVFRAGGKGGQHQNKTSSGVRCIHPPSGAVGIARDQRSQLQNKRLAFERCVEDPKFKTWVKMEAGMREVIESNVEQALLPYNIKTEVHDETGRWVTVRPEELSDE